MRWPVVEKRFRCIIRMGGATWIRVFFLAWDLALHLHINTTKRVRGKKGVEWGVLFTFVLVIF